MLAPEATYSVELSIPARPELVGVARLALARVASLLDFSFDAVEDIRLAVGEACSRAMERMARHGRCHEMLHVRCRVRPGILEIEVCSPLLPSDEGPGLSAEQQEEEELGAMLVHLLMDECSEETLPEQQAHILRMVKHLAPRE